MPRHKPKWSTPNVEFTFNREAGTDGEPKTEVFRMSLIELKATTMAQRQVLRLIDRGHITQEQAAEVARDLAEVAALDLGDLTPYVQKGLLRERTSARQAAGSTKQKAKDAPYTKKAKILAAPKDEPATVIAKRLNCSPAHVHTVLREQRKKESL